MIAYYIGKKYKGVTPGKSYEIICEKVINKKLNYYFINDNQTIDYRRAKLFKETTLSENMRLLDKLDEEE